MKKKLCLLPLLLFEFSIRAQNITVTGNTYFAVPNGANVAVPGDITINSTGAFSNSGTVSLTSDWTNNGTVSTGNGLYILNGTSKQTLDGNTLFDTLRLNNSAGAALASGAGVDIFTALQLQNGNFDVSGGRMTFLSTSVNQCAIIDNFSAGNSGNITGNIIAQRYFAAPTTTNSYNQHEMGSPVNAPALSQFGASGTAGYVTDFNCDQTKLDLTSPYGTVFGYDETHGAACGIEQWKVLTSGNASNGAGYSILSGGPGTLSLTGAPNISGNVTMNGTNSGWANSTLQGYPEQSGWTLASNPYPATLNISSTSLTNNVDAGFDGVGVMVWNTTGASAGSYQLTTTLAPFQAFMVHKTNPSGSATYTIYATDRATSAGTFYKEAAASTLNITATNQSSGLTDVTIVGYNLNAVSGFDPNFDVHKIPGDIGRHAIYTLSNNDWMYQNVNSSIEQAPAIQMGFAPGVSGTYTLTFDGVNSFDATSYIILEDTKLNIFHDARSGDYTFTSDATNDNWNRFVLHFTPPAEILTSDATCETPGMINITQPGTAQWNYTVTDNNVTTIASGILNQNSRVSISTVAGVYTLTLADNNGYTVVKNIEVNGAQPVIAAFTPSTNTALTAQNITFNSSSNAAGYSWDFGDGTTATGSPVMHSYQTEGAYNVQLTVNSASGCASATTQVITVTNRSVTGISNVSSRGGLRIWSNDNRVYIDFTGENEVNANIEIYNVIGQLLSSERFGKSTVYSKAIDNMEAAYLIVKVMNDGELTTQKVFIANIK